MEPVKWMPARWGLARAMSLTSLPWPGTRLITPSGNPARRRISTRNCAAKLWVSAGFHSTGLPISAAEVGRFPAIAVKLNGVIA